MIIPPRYSNEITFTDPSNKRCIFLNLDKNLNTEQKDLIYGIENPKNFNILKKNPNLAIYFIATERNIVPFVLKHLIKIVPNFSIYDNSGNTLLSYLLDQNDPDKDILADLIEKADFNTQNLSRETPLYHLIKYKNPNKDIIISLIKKGANFNVENYRNETSLSYLVKYRKPHKDVIIELTKTGANFNFADNEGMTPLHYFLKNNNPDKDVIIELAKTEADFNFADAKGRNALCHYLAFNRNANIETFEDIIKNVNIINQNECDYFINLMENPKPNLKLAKHLIDKGFAKDIKMELCDLRIFLKFISNIIDKSDTKNKTDKYEEIILASDIIKSATSFCIENSDDKNKVTLITNFLKSLDRAQSNSSYKDICNKLGFHLLQFLPQESYETSIISDNFKKDILSFRQKSAMTAFTSDTLEAIEYNIEDTSETSNSLWDNVTCYIYAIYDNIIWF